MDTIENFIGIFPAAVSKELCEKTINHFHYIQKTRGYEQGGLLTRQQNDGFSTKEKESDMYFF